MKKIFAILTLVLSFHYAHAQNINWQSIQDNQNNLAYVNFGYDFGLTTQLGYGLQLDAFRPILLTADYSFPMGKNLVDDFKLRIGGQISAYQRNNFILSANVYGLFRRHQTSLVRMASFGSELSALAGFYKPTWHLAAEFGFDKSINTHLKHSEAMKEHFAGINDGWFTPSGGHFFYGIQASKTLKKSLELSLSLGATKAQSKDQAPLLPYYGQLGLVWKFSQP